MFDLAVMDYLCKMFKSNEILTQDFVIFEKLI